jgi:hypothetical protein
MRDVKIINEGVRMYRAARAIGLVGAEPMPDDIIAWSGEHWNTLGYSSFIVFRVIERGIPWDMLDHAMTRLVGEDWAAQSCTNWMHKMEINGIEDFDCDEPPFCDMMTDLVLKYEYGWWRE